MEFLYVFLTVLGIFLILLLIAVLRAMSIKKSFQPSKHFSLEEDSIDWEKHAHNLSEMLKVRSVSILGKPDPAHIYEFHEKLEQLYPLIHQKLEKVDIDGALLFRWAGKNKGKKPILLMSHMDVVEAQGQWSHEPFAGDIADGKIWGRGAVDTKGALCAILESVEYLLSTGFQPDCDVYVASSNNEEVTGDGAIKTVEYLYEKGVELDLVLDEGGAVMGSMLSGATGLHAMVGIFEKGRANIKFTAHSQGGHASIPPKDDPFSRLAKFIYQMEYHSPFKKKITPPVEHMFSAMAPYLSFPYRLVLGNIWLFGPILPKVMGKMGGQPNALVSTTCVFTMAEGSHGANVIPETASVTANMRFMIHEGLEKSLKKVFKLTKKLDIWAEMIAGFDYSDVADMNTYAYRQTTACIQDVFGDIPIIPYVMLAGTDSRHYTKICKCVLRFVPLILTNEQQHSAHAIDENLNVSSLARGVLYYVKLIQSYTN